MHIGIKTIAGIGIAAALAFGASIPAYADGNNSGDSIANATDNSVTQNLTDSQVQFKYTSIGAYDVSFTWNADAMKVDGDNSSWCDVMLWAKNPFINGYDNGEDTFDWTTNSYHFGLTDNGDGTQSATVSPGDTFRVQLLCHNSSDELKYSYMSDWFTAKDLPVGAPSKPLLKTYYGTDIMALNYGAEVSGESTATTCLYRLYNNGSIVKNVSENCSGGGSHYFANLPAGTYQVQTAEQNSAGLSAWSPISDKVTLKGSSSSVAVPTVSSTAPSYVNPTFGIAGKTVHITWSKAKTNKGSAIKQYKVTIIKGTKTAYKHTFTTKRAFTKTLTPGTYKVTITAINKSDKQTTTSAKLKL